jgi:hypothetical protein
VVKSKTAQGFIANFASAGQKSLDRTEPMIGAKVLLELYRKFGDKWIVELLLDDLIDWCGALPTQAANLLLLKLLHECVQLHSSRVFTPLY